MALWRCGCAGKPILEDVNEMAKDPLRAIAEKYFHLPCSVMTPNDRRLDTLTTLVVRFATPPAMGWCRLVLAPSILDLSGMSLDQDRDGAMGENPDDRYEAVVDVLYSGRLTQDTVWGPQQGTILAGQVTLDGGATLTIQAGTIVKFYDSHSGITLVRGTLDVQGTLQSPVVLTALANDTVGSDTNNDGGASQPGAGDWAGLEFLDMAARAVIEHARIRYADYAILWDETVGDGATIALRNSILADGNFGVYIYAPYVQLEAENVLIANNQNTGLFVRADSREVVRNSTIVGNGFGGSGWHGAGVHVGGVDHVLLTFSEPVDVATFDPSDVQMTGPGGPIAIASVAPVAGRVWRVNFAPQSATGEYHVLIGPQIEDTADHLVDQDRDAVAGETQDDVYDAAFRLTSGGALATGLYVTGHSPAGVHGDGASFVEVRFDRPVLFGTFTRDDVTITGPSGAIAPTDVQPLSSTSFRITIPEQTDYLEYRFTIGPDVRDASGNAMDQNGDGVNGDPGDSYAGDFGILPGTVAAVTGAAVKAGDASRPDVIIVEGQVKADGAWASSFSSGVHMTAMLFEQDGLRDPKPGEPSGSDPEDDLVSDWNLWTQTEPQYNADSYGRGPVGNNGKFLFAFDTSKQPIRCVDPDGGAGEPLPRYYVVVFAKSENAVVIDYAAWVDGVLAAGAKPWWTLGVPAPTTAPAGVTQSYGRIHNAPMHTLEYCLEVNAVPQGTQVLSPPAPLQVEDPYFGIPEWIRFGAAWIRNAVGADPYHPIGVAVPWSAEPNSATFDWHHDCIELGANCAPLPGAILHEYAHAMEFSANSMQMWPYGGGGDYGMISQTASLTTAFAEGWASFVAARALDGVPVWDNFGVIPGNAESQARYKACCNESAKGLERNEFWMGADGFAGLTNPTYHGQYEVDHLVPTHVNKDGNIGDRVMGAIMSILYDLVDQDPPAPVGDDPIADPKRVWTALCASASANTRKAFYDAYTAGMSPHARKAVDAIFIDNGVPVADDDAKGNDIPDKAKPKGSLGGGGEMVIKGILAKQDPAHPLKILEGAGDWYSFGIPPLTTNPRDEFSYGVTVTLTYDKRYGHIGLFAMQGNTLVKEVSSEEPIAVEGLKSSQSYTIKVGVVGSGVTWDGEEFVGYGDFHPEYTITIAGPKKPDPPSAGTGGGDTAVLPIYTSLTPKDKLGPSGYDAPGTPAGSEVRFIPAGEALNYRVEFWNKPEALVPTQDAAIRDTLDPAVFDLNTFQFTRIGFLKWDVPPAGGQAIDTRIDCRPDMNIAVDVKASINRQTGVIDWWFHCVDPVTGDYPEDPFAGFLPPYNAETGYEIGWVEFSVQPKAGLATGTQIKNQAFVEFDFAGDMAQHPAPKAGPWLNTFDAVAPSSAVEALPASLGRSDFVVRWGGQDDAGGAGLTNYDVYASTDGGAFTRWIGDTTDTSAVFHGQPGHTYAFHTVARDFVGHEEAVPASPDARRGHRRHHPDRRHTDLEARDARLRPGERHGAGLHHAAGIAHGHRVARHRRHAPGNPCPLDRHTLDGR